MARPTKWRRIKNIPNFQYFAPSEESFNDIPENILKMEELEAIRLKDIENMEQEDCAVNMQISRPTFQRILISARKKVADSLINGKAIRIEGGNFTLNICPVKCLSCGKEWNESFENLETIKTGEYECFACGSNKITCDQPCAGNFCRRNCRRHNQGK